MIQYTPGIRTVFQLSGSVFPAAALVAIPSSCLTLALNILLNMNMLSGLPFFSDIPTIMSESAAWTAFSGIIGFLVVFRTSQAYTRFWDGCTATNLMRAEWFDAVSSITAFTKYSQASEEKTLLFKHCLIRLFSMMHALALAEIEDADDEEVMAFSYELIDVESIDKQSLKSVKDAECKVELVFQWIQQLLVQNIDNKVLCIPPPILSRSFQELATGMVQYHEARKISDIPFPFPYAQTCDVLLLLHSLGTPFIVCSWTSQPYWAFILAFLQVFILWCLNNIALELQNPFGSDANDLDTQGMQIEMNKQLGLLLNPMCTRTPSVSTKVLKQTLKQTMGEEEETNFDEDEHVATQSSMRSQSMAAFGRSQSFAHGRQQTIVPKSSFSRVWDDLNEGSVEDNGSMSQDVFMVVEGPSKMRPSGAFQGEAGLEGSPLELKVETQRSLDEDFHSSLEPAGLFDQDIKICDSDHVSNLGDDGSAVQGTWEPLEGGDARTLGQPRGMAGVGGGGHWKATMGWFLSMAQDGGPTPGFRRSFDVDATNEREDSTDSGVDTSGGVDTSCEGYYPAQLGPTRSGGKQQEETADDIADEAQAPRNFSHSLGGGAGGYQGSGKGVR